MWFSLLAYGSRNDPRGREARHHPVRMKRFGVEIEATAVGDICSRQRPQRRRPLPSHQPTSSAAAVQHTAIVAAVIAIMVAYHGA